MMRRKLGILILAGFTMLAGAQEATRQFDGLRASVDGWTRASLWSGLIVYAQPVADGKLPAPQIYYLMPQPHTAPATTPQDAVLADNNSNNAPAKPETKSNHGAAESAALAANTQAVPPSPEAENAAESELILREMAPPVVAVQVAAAAPKPERMRVYEEVARNEAGTRRFKAHAETLAKVLVKEFDADKLDAELTRLAEVHEQLETTKLKSFADAEHATRRLELRVLRRAPHPERIKVIAPPPHRRTLAPPEISSVGCEKTRKAPEASTAAVAVAGIAAASVRIASESLAAAEAGTPAVPTAPTATGTSWTLGCDTEPEYR